MDQERQQDGRFREPIAVIGSGCRFPGASSSPSKLWELLQQPRDVLKEFDPERLNLSRFHHKSGDTHGATDVGNKSYLLEEDTRLFDAAFFGISPVEAAGMDPQQRILLEAVYEAFESAGMTLDELRGSFTSVHVGCMTSDWANIQARDTETVPKYNATGSANSILSNRISYIFDLKGPSETIDTACSSSLVALHNAARGLLNGDCNAAVVAGVNLILDPAPYINESKLHMLSPDARSRMWDKAANGYARGEGAGALLLKKLSQALKDGDHIEGLVRATGVNSDGQSPGITMPFSPTQTALIQETYARAGLDPIKDRPQYIECHGTGTPAGDPVEAQALSNAFIGQGDKSTENPIFVGSIKTVIGHLEGGAGIAGVIKVLLSIKHRVIPPNLLFKDLNPDIAPYYGPLQIPTTAVPWPKLPPGTPARASVNSFGFGGTNSHAIIESFEEGSVPRPNSAEEGIVGPLLFSAKSGASLLRSVRDNLEYMHKDPSLDLRDLSALLQSRRTTHRCRAHFSGSSRDAILEKMADFVKIHEKSASDQIGHQPQLINPKEVPGVLGVFTGQGAQWPSMGRELIQKSSLFRKYIQECEAVLNALPEKDRPKWSLTEELMKDAASSRIAEAALSQPLCSAVQLALVKLLQAAGIKFDAVVGHSSGEIAATFAAGIITLQGAMQIAYYRGLHAKSAGGANGAKGAMMAAGLSFVEAKQFCSRSEFDGRIKVAASNAPKSVTLSGDLDAITKAHEILQADNVFARRLQVDTAYHSHHMLPCSQPYLKSLLACNIKVMQPTGKCTWVSSVRGDTQLLRGDLSSLKGQYWVDNMVRTVLFTQAIESSIWHGGPFDLAIEVGPHPALKGPTEQTLKASYGALPVYTGVLKRGGNDVEAFSSAIGTAWAQLGPAFVDFAGYRSLFYKAGTPALRIPKGLPTYSWDHDKVFWREGRLSRRFRLGNDQGHELLGRRTLDDNDTELRWRNVLKLSEMPWLRGHEVLGEVLLPGASYVSIAVQAGQSIAATMGKGVRLIEVSNINILRPVVVPEGVDGVETLFTTRIVETTKDHILAEFTYYVCPDESLGSMLQTCNGDILVYLETQSDFASQDTLPPKGAMPSNLTSIDTERVYSLFKDIGLNYSGLFRGITTIDRQLDYASTKSTWAEGLDSAYVVHPAMLDVAFQTMFIAKAHPASRQISSALLPSHIDRVRINPSVQFAQPSGGAETAAEFETWAVKQTANSLVGDLNVYDAATGKTFLQVEGLAVNSVGEQDSSSDRSMFSRTLWGQDVTLGLPDPIRDPVKDAEGLQMAHAVERVALFYVKNILKEVGQEERAGFQWYHQRMFEAFEEHVRVVKSGEHPIILPEWLDDEASILDELDAKHGETIDFKLLHAVGKDLADVVRGNKQMLEVMTKDDMLNRFYMEGYASVPTNKAVGDVMRQLSFKFPRARILEIGAGTGGTSWSVLNCIDDAYESYTYTDVSSGFFHLAEEKFAKFAHKMIFKVLDIEQEPKEQGFEEQSYDIIVAALVLHATHDLEKTMRHARSLLKPGGFLVMVELTGTMSVRATLVMGGLPGWWLGENDGRRLSPLVTAVEWDRLLQDTGFSGADAVIHDLADEEKHCTALIMGQAVDDDFQRLRSPLSTVAELPLPTDPIVVIGGKRLSTSKVVREIQKLLPKKWARHTLAYKSIDEIDVSKVTPSIDILSLQDFDEPPFSHTVTAHRMAIIQSLLMNAKNLLWVTGARESQNPRANLIHGIMRVVPSELPQLNVQVLGLDATETPAALAKNSVEMFLRLRETGTDGGNSHREMLWSMEPELDIVRDQIIIPRVVPDVDLNELYNASKRAITKTVDSSKTPVNVVQKDGKLSLQIAAATKSDNGIESIKVYYSARIPSTSGDELFIIGGRSESSWVVAITNVNASIAQVDETHVFPIEEKDCTPDNLSAIANYVLSWAVTTVAAPYASVLLFEADDSLAASVKAELAAVGSKTILASTHGHGHPTNDIKIHALASKRAIQRLVPRDVQLYIDCSLGASPAAATLAQSMPSKCIVRQLSADLVQEALRGAAKPVAELLGEACASSDIEATAVPLIPAAKLAGASAISLKTQPYITDWKTQVSISTTIQPLNLDGLFKPDKTYFMAGMAGGLGLSICQWMIRNGAKHMVITSRRPQVDEATLEEAERVGATVKVLAMDLTNKDSVEKVVREVRDTMPPIAGVCNAAMVLKDGFFVDMDVDQFNNTLAAKVIGSENLDAVFNDAPLDFFILLGSVASVIGNVGQSNYHAANLFMTSLVHQRRARGLAASIIHIAYVTDVGYVTREERDRQLDSHFRKVRLMPTSETDVHHAFAEAVKGGKPESTSGYYDIIMGIEPLGEQIPSDQQPLWMKNPRFAHFDQHAIHAQNDRSSTGSTENVRALVEKAEQEEEAIDAVMAAFCTKLESILQLTAGSINVQRPITDLGIDSLVAVEIRTWFLKELGADVPVVKILGGDTVQQLSTIATKKLLAKNMEAGAEKKSTTEKPAEAAAPVRVPAPAPLAPSPRIAVESSNVVPADRSPSPPNQSDPVLTPESDRPAFLTAQRAVDFDSVSVLTAATSKQEESISSNSSYTKDETPDSDDKSERSVSVADDKADEMRIRPEILREERMSPAQARLWFMSQHLENSSAYNMAFRYRVKGPIGIARLKHALSVTTYNHECLRMCFYSRLEDGQPMQGLMASSLYQFNHIVNASDADVDREMSRLSTRKWDLEYGHTMEVSLISRSSEDHDMIIAYHHIVMDSMGLGIVLNDLNSAYNMRPLNRSAGSYMDFSVQQLEQQTRGEFDEQLSFWEAEFKTIPETLPRLPFANISGAPGDEPVPDTYHQYRELNDAQFASLKATCQQLRISPFHFHLALLQVLLSRYTNTEDLCIGVVDANRNNHQYAGTVGCFVNMVPVRLHMPLGKTGFADVAQHTRQSALRALEHSTVPFDMIIDKIKIPRSSGSTPLFQAALNYRTGSLWEMPLGQAKMTMADVKDANNPYDLSLGIAETRTGCMVEFYVSSSAYSSEACCTIMDAYMRLLDDFSSNPDLQIGNCNVYDKSGIESSLKVGKGPVITFGWPATLSQRFLDMVRRHHEDAAVTDKTGTLTYAELMERVNAVCDTLVRYGCGSGSHIAVLCEPSIDTIVSMLAILHIGAVYVPLDVSLPTARHVAMIHSSKPSLIVSHSTTDGLARDCIDKVDFPIRRVVLDDIPDEEVRVTVPCVASPDTCSVILFTSGSTGTPKGIMLSQANFVNHLALKTHLLGLGKETVLQQSSTGFDMSMIQMFCALANGGRLVIAPFEIRRDPIEMASLIRSEQISLSIATPSEYLAWTRYGASSLKENTAWRHICMGGEPVTRQLVLELRRLGLPNLRVTNCYGPTEITAAASFHTVDLGSQGNLNADTVKYTVGKVLPNYTVSILDVSGSPQPVNYTGEICIGGAGVALGYVNASGDAASNFIVTAQGQRMYRTGDRGRLLSDGTLLLFGRIDGDAQIKLRGLRIDLQEVELAVLEAANGLLSTVVVSQRGDVLIAHATVSADKAAAGSVTDDDLTGVLRRLTLPQYFIPARIITLSSLPTNANGKLDRKAIAALPLPQTQFTAGPTSSEEKMTVGEGELRLLWERVLPQAASSARISPSSDFFLLGGNSLLLMKLQAAIKDSMNVIMSTRKLYQASTLRDMARAVDEQRRSQTENDAELEIDWAAETAIPKWLLNQIHELSNSNHFTRSKSPVEKISVLMTGATTFLGGHLLKSLLQSDTVSQIYCVAVPADDQKLLPEDEKIECFTGSLLSPTLGLNAAERERLESVADVIVHAGGSGHCLNTYATLRTPNVVSTQFLASMALPRSIPLLFLSSNRVVLLTGNTSPPAASVSAFPPATDGREGHMMSKWTSEVFLENLVSHLQGSSLRHQQKPWTVAVHRPSVIVSENAPNSDALNAILRYSILMQSSPRMDNVRGYLDLAQLDTVVAELCQSVIQLGSGQSNQESTDIIFKHHSGGVQVPATELWSHLEKVYGVTFDEVEMDEWLRRAAKAGIDPLITAYLEAIQSNGAKMIFPYMGSD